MYEEGQQQLHLRIEWHIDHLPQVLVPAECTIADEFGNEQSTPSFEALQIP
jgi:hypothetical protein